MLEKKTKGNESTNPLLENGLYMRRRSALIKIKSSLRMVNHPLVELKNNRGLFRVVDGIIIPLSGVSGIRFTRTPRRKE